MCKFYTWEKLGKKLGKNLGKTWEKLGKMHFTLLGRDHSSR